MIDCLVGWLGLTSFSTQRGHMRQPSKHIIRAKTLLQFTQWIQNQTLTVKQRPLLQWHVSHKEEWFPKMKYNLTINSNSNSKFMTYSFRLILHIYKPLSTEGTKTSHCINMRNTRLNILAVTTTLICGYYCLALNHRCVDNFILNDNDCWQCDTDLTSIIQARCPQFGLSCMHGQSAMFYIHSLIRSVISVQTVLFCGSTREIPPAAAVSTLACCFTYSYLINGPATWDSMACFMFGFQDITQKWR